MLARVDFTTAGRRHDDGRASGVRPDLVVHLPGGKHVVVDAKAPLAAFLEASEESADPRAAAGGRRGARPGAARARRRRWRPRSTGRRSSRRRSSSSASCRARRSWPRRARPTPALLEHAMSRRVVLATPTTLLALLRTVALTWQSEALTGNARELFEVGPGAVRAAGQPGRPHRAAGPRPAARGRGLQRLVGTLERRVLVTARRMHDLDVTDAELPSHRWSTPCRGRSRPRPGGRRAPPASRRPEHGPCA